MAYNQPEEFILLGTQNATNSASLSFTSLITSQYPVYFLKIRNLIPATNATSLLLTFSTDNGSTYLNSSYLWSNTSYTSNSITVQTKSAADSTITVCATVSNSSTNIGVCGNFYMYNFAKSLPAMIQGQMGFENSNSFIDGRDIAGMNSGTTAVNAIKFAMSAGNITSGSIYLYGMTI